MSLGERAIGQSPGRPQGPIFPKLNNSMKISSSEMVLNRQGNTSTVDGEPGQGLFGDFKMLDLDLGGSGSSDDEVADEEIMLKNDGSLSLVPRKTSQRDSMDMSMFRVPSGQSQERGTADMETITEPPEPDQVGDSNGENVPADRRITFAMTGGVGNDEDAEAATGSGRLGIRQATERSMASAASLSSGGLIRSLSQSQSASFARGMVRTESAAALRLKEIFAAAETESDTSDG